MDSLELVLNYLIKLSKEKPKEEVQKIMEELLDKFYIDRETTLETLRQIEKELKGE